MSSTSTNRATKEKRDPAWMALAFNLGMAPGAGSIIAGRWLIGGLTFAVALSGFCVVMVGFWRILRMIYHGSEPSTAWTFEGPHLLRGLAIFGGAWLASAFDTFLIFRSRPKPSPATPPPLIP